MKIGSIDSVLQESQSQISTQKISGISVAIGPTFPTYQGRNPIENPVACYFPNDPDYDDWYDGPCNVSISEQRSFNAKFSSTTGLPKWAVTQTVGFEVGAAYSRQVTYSISATSSERVNIKVYSNNKETKYEEWRVYINSQGMPVSEEYLGYRYAYNPIGSIWKQFRYSK